MLEIAIVVSMFTAVLSEVRVPADTTAARQWPPPQPTSHPFCPPYHNTSASLLDYGVPWECTGPNMCLETFCICGHGSFDAARALCRSFRPRSMAEFHACVAPLFSCLLSTSVALSHHPRGERDGLCDGYAHSLVADIAEYDAAQTRNVTRLGSGCNAAVCNMAMDFFIGLSIENGLCATLTLGLQY